MSWPQLAKGRTACGLDQLFAKPEEKLVLAPGEPEAPLAGATWVPPAGASTLSGLGITVAKTFIGRDAIVRDDPYFGRRGIIKKVIPDERYGFLVAVHVYKRSPERPGKWEELFNAPPEARKFLIPSRVEIAS